MENAEKTCLDCLGQILSQDLPEWHYSMGCYGDDAICIEKSGKKWVVYYGSRGNKCCLDTYNNILSACIAVLARAYVSADDADRATDMFVRSVVRVTE